jgi:hypothetical protein
MARPGTSNQRRASPEHAGQQTVNVNLVVCMQPLTQLLQYARYTNIQISL